MFYLDRRPVVDSVDRTHGGWPGTVVELGDYFGTEGRASTKSTVFVPEWPLLREDDDGFLACGRKKPPKLVGLSAEHLNQVWCVRPSGCNQYPGRLPPHNLNSRSVAISSHQPEGLADHDTWANSP